MGSKPHTNWYQGVSHRIIRSRPGEQASAELEASFFFQAEDGIRDLTVTGVQTCALPICRNVAGEQAVLNIVDYCLTLILACEKRVVRIREWHVGNARHRGAALLLGLLTGSESQRTHCTPVETAQKADESRASTDIARQFQCPFHRFSAGLAEKTEHRLAHRRQCIDLFGESDLSFMPVIRRNVQKSIGRVFDRLNYLRV